MAVVRNRKIGLHHIAFFRAFFEGSMDIRVIARRYLETGSDITAARETLKMIQDAFVATALKVGLDSEAQWLVLPESAYRGKSDVDLRLELDSPASEATDEDDGLEDFEAWRDRTDPGGFFGENELIEMYEAENADLIKAAEARKAASAIFPSRKVIGAVELSKRINLINRLSLEIVSKPRLSDTVDGWFSPAVSRRLMSANIFTLQDIVTQANEHGFRWFRFVPKLGEKTATKIVQWLGENDDGVGSALRKTAIKPIRQIDKSALVITTPRYAVTTLETLSVPHALSGVDGSNRGELSRNKLDATDDYAAIHEWLGLHENVAHTFLSYRKEAERLLLWAVLIKKKPMSSLTTSDMNSFFMFIANPPEDWCSDRRYERYHENWKPFVEDKRRVEQKKNGEPVDPLLSPRSVRQARAIISSLFEWLVGQLYLDTNPIKGLPEDKSTEKIKVDHSFTKAQWRHVVRFLEAMPLETVADFRVKFLIVFAYGTGLRLHEIAKATTGNLILTQFEESDLADVYMLDIVGKGKRRRTLPVPRLAIVALQDYLEKRGQLRHVKSNPDATPLITSLYKSDKAVTTKTIYLLIKDFFGNVANTLDIDSESHRRFNRASTHWLRHTYGSHAANGSASLSTVQENLGHSSLNTTSIYIKSDDESRWREMDSFMETGFSSS